MTQFLISILSDVTTLDLYKILSGVSMFQLIYKLNHSYMPIFAFLLVIIIFNVFIKKFVVNSIEITQLDLAKKQMNKMGKTIMNAFTNSLPRKILPKIMSAQKLPCDIVDNVNFCYIHLKTDDSLGSDINYISKINHFYCILDFFAEMMQVQKIKSSYQYFMCCTGAQKYLSKDNSLQEHDYPNQYDSSKILFTFCLLSQYMAEAFDLKCCCGITKGSIIMGAVSLSTSIINFDTYGDVINTAARIAKNNKSGVFIKIDDFKKNHKPKDDILDNNDEDDVQQIMEAKINFETITSMFLKASPQYIFGCSELKKYKGKGNVKIIEVQANEILKRYACQALQRAYIILFGECDKGKDDNSINITDLEERIDSSLHESSESFVSASQSYFDVVFNDQSNISSSEAQLKPIADDDEAPTELPSKQLKHNKKEKFIRIEKIDIFNIDANFDVKGRLEQLQQVNKFITETTLQENLFYKTQKHISGSKSGQDFQQKDILQVPRMCQPKSEQCSVDESASGVDKSKHKFIDQIIDTEDSESKEIKFSEIDNFSQQQDKFKGGRQQFYGHNNISSSSKDAVLRSKSHSKDSSDEHKYDSKEVLLRPELHNFFEKAKESNALRTTRSSNSSEGTQVRLQQRRLSGVSGAINVDELNPTKDEKPYRLYKIAEEDEIQEAITNQRVENCSGSLHETETSDTNMEQIADEQKVTQPIIKPQENKKTALKYQQLIDMVNFLFSFSKDITEVLCNKIDVLENWMSHVSFKLMLVDIVALLLNLLCAFVILNGVEFKVYSVIQYVNLKDAYIGFTFMQIALSFLFHLYQYHFFTSLQRELIVQKKKHIPSRLQKMFNGPFQTFNQIYSVSLLVMFMFKQLLILKAITQYHEYQIYYDNVNRCLTMYIIDSFLFEFIMLQAFGFISQMLNIVSFNLKVYILFKVILSVIVIFQSRSLTLITIIFMLMKLLYIYPKLESFYQTMIKTSAMRDQVTQGKSLLKNILPQITIDSLLLMTLDKDSKEIVSLDISKYKILKLKSMDQLLECNTLAKMKLQETGKLNEEEYYDYRLKQLVTKYLKLPNPHTFGSDRPLIDFGEVAYLNLDICQFTRFCSEHNVQVNLSFLSNLFNKFDRRIKMTKNLIQVKISGDSYELMALPTLIKRYSQVRIRPEKIQKLEQYEAVTQMISIGLGFIQDCRDVLKDYVEWQRIVGLRVGIAFGQVNGSLLGNNICRFDTFGPVPGEAEAAQSATEVNTVMLQANVVQLLCEGEDLLKDYIVDHITTESLKGNVVDYQDEVAEFEYFWNSFGKGIRGVK